MDLLRVILLDRMARCQTSEHPVPFTCAVGLFVQISKIILGLLFFNVEVAHG